jgi:hypothetical protein
MRIATSCGKSITGLRFDMLRAIRTPLDDMRRSPRFSITAEALYRWYEAEKGGLQQVTGVTRDISRSGVHMCGAVIPQPGTPLFLQVSMPSLREGSRPLLLQSTGKVVWTGPSNDAGSTDFGAAVDHSLFLEMADKELKPVQDDG